jgi:hypothetical protein
MNNLEINKDELKKTQMDDNFIPYYSVTGSPPFLCPYCGNITMGYNSCQSCAAPADEGATLVGIIGQDNYFLRSEAFCYAHDE